MDKLTMETILTHKARLTIDCSQEEKRLIRILAAMNDKKISGYVMDLLRAEMCKNKFIDSSNSAAPLSSLE